MRRIFLTLSAVLAAGATVAALPALASTKVVVVGDNFFGMDGHVHGVGVARGAVVRWTWTGRARHNVTVISGPQRFRSPTRRRGSFERRMTRPGRYSIVCTIHGRADQSMTLMVR
jgi:plastocyanin